jgi:hypothetical protein
MRNTMIKHLQMDAHELNFSLSMHEQLLTDVQQHAPYYLEMIKQTQQRKIR